MLNSTFIGKRIKELRKELRMSQEQLAGENFTKSYISKLENGAVTPSIKALEILSNTLGVPLSTFIESKESDDTHLKDFLFALNQFETRKYAQSFESFEKLLKIKQTLDKEMLLKVYYYLAESALKSEEYEKCMNYCNDALETIEDVDNIYTLRIVLSLGDAYYYLNQRSKSLETFLRAQELIENHNVFIDTLTRIELCHDIAILYTQFANRQKSVEYYQRIIDISLKEKIINERVLAAYNGLAQVSQLYEKDIEKSLSYLNSEILSVLGYFGSYTELAKIYLKYSYAYFEKDDMEKYLYYMQKVEETMSKIKCEDCRGELDIYIELYKGKYEMKLGNLEKAQQLIGNAYKDAVSSEKHILAKIAVLINYGNLEILKKNPDKAIEYLEEGQKISAQIEFNLRLPEIYQSLGKAYILKGDSNKATEYFDKVYNLLKQ